MRLDIPTIMWHKSSVAELGLSLTPVGDLKHLDYHNTPYYDLADENENIVGKVFLNLKLFVIEDQELLFAMSYKSNRNWTLPKCGVGINMSHALC